MRMLARLRDACHRLVGRRQFERDLDDELRFALEELTARFIAGGLSPGAAARAARKELGAVDLIKEDVRGGGFAHTVETLMRDTAYAWRGLARAPVFSLVVVAVLAGGIGAAAAIFSIVNALLLSPLPYRDAGRLVFVWQDLTDAGYPRAPLSGPELQDLRHRSSLFTGFGGIWANTATLTGTTDPEQLRIGLVTPDFFTILGADARLGRTFRDEDETQDAGMSVLLSADLWRRRFGGREEIVGQRIEINGRPATVIGVMPETFKLLLPPDSAIPDDQQAWLLLGRDFARGPRQQQFLRVIGRMKPGVELTAAQREVAAIARQVGREFPEYGASGATFYGVGLQAEAMREIRPALTALFAAVCLLLVIGCVNVGGLLVARAATRQHETAIRLAIGASRGRIFRQSLAEGVVLSLLGGAAGVLLSYGLLAGLLALRPASVARIDSTTIDLRVLGFAAAVSIGWGLLFALAPFSQAFRTNVSHLLHASGRISAGGGAGRVRTALVTIQVALSVVLLVIAGLLARGFHELHRVDLGFVDRGVLTFKISLAGSRYRGPEPAATFSRQLRERLAGIPGVEAVGATSHVPYDTVPNWGTPYLPEGVIEESQTGLADARAVTPGYFTAVGARLAEGRWFDDRDHRKALPVAIIDTNLSARLWPGQSAIGKRVKADPGTTGTPQVLVTIIGVVHHLRHRDLTRNLREQMYFPAQQSFRNPMAYVVKSSAEPADLVSAVRQALTAVDPAVPIYDVRPLRGYTGDARAMRKFTLTLTLAFAGSALLLAAIGVYGVSAYLVTQRRREFGVRFALGARAGEVMRLVLRDGIRVALVGSVAGSIGAMGGAGLLRAQLYGVSASDPLTFAAGVTAVCLAVIAACLIPAFRAARVSPLESLRAD
jgi:predicted permease